MQDKPCFQQSCRRCLSATYARLSPSLSFSALPVRLGAEVLMSIIVLQLDEMGLYARIPLFHL
jgi:hypothetical protein